MILIPTENHSHDRAPRSLARASPPPCCRGLLPACGDDWPARPTATVTGGRRRSTRCSSSPSGSAATTSTVTNLTEPGQRAARPRADRPRRPPTLAERRPGRLRARASSRPSTRPSTQTPRARSTPPRSSTCRRRRGLDDARARGEDARPRRRRPALLARPARLADVADAVADAARRGRPGPRGRRTRANADRAAGRPRARSTRSSRDGLADLRARHRRGQPRRVRLPRRATASTWSRSPASPRRRADAGRPRPSCRT